MVVKINHIAKIEGHARLAIRIEDEKVRSVDLQIIEGARFFEAILKDRYFHEVPELASRICGTCSPAHAVTALTAVERALQITPSEQTKLLRELLYMGMYLQNHVVHLYFLALPDYLGYSSAIELTSKYPEVIKRALRFKRLGNDIATTIGGREVHPICAVVGGFSRLPTQNDLDSLLKKLKDARKDAVETAKLFGSLKYPDFKRETEYIALRQKDRYALMDGNVCMLSGEEFPQQDYDKHIREYLHMDSTSKFAIAKDKGYMVGALARIFINQKLICEQARNAFQFYDKKFPDHNPYLNNFAQAVETIHFIERAIEIIENLKLKEEKWGMEYVDDVHQGRGVGITEAPRGIVIHDHQIGGGLLQIANIITPTTQNLKNIEDDINVLLPKIVTKSETEIIGQLEKLIRAYDPCISCSTHFLELDLKRI